MGKLAGADIETCKSNASLSYANLGNTLFFPLRSTGEGSCHLTAAPRAILPHLLPDDIWWCSRPEG